MYLKHYEISYAFIFSNGKSLKGWVVGRDQSVYDLC